MKTVRDIVFMCRVEQFNYEIENIHKRGGFSHTTRLMYRISIDMILRGTF